MGRNVIVAGTGFDNPNSSNRCEIIKRYVEDEMPVYLEREPDNKYDKNAIAVYIIVPVLLGLFQSKKQIGYIKSDAAKSLAKKMDDGVKITGEIASYYAPSNIKHPRVSLALDY